MYLLNKSRITTNPNKACLLTSNKHYVQEKENAQYIKPQPTLVSS